MDSKLGQTQKPFKIHLVSSNDSPEFTRLTRSLTRSALVALDAEWKPTTRSDSQKPAFPAVSLLQLACRPGADSDESGDSVVFLLDLLSIPLESISDLLREVLVSPDILKLGFRFKQDLVYLSSTFSSHGIDNGFDRVEPFMDITSIYNYIQHNQYGNRMSKNIKSLASICKEVSGISLSKELQCSDWSHRPLTEAQISYAAMDAHCLLDIFDVFQTKVIKEWDLIHNVAEPKEVVEVDDMCDRTLRMNLCEASDMNRETACSDISRRKASEQGMALGSHKSSSLPMDESLFKVVRKFSGKLLLEESDKNPKTSKKKGKRRSSAGLTCKESELEILEDWQGPPPWDSSNGGNGFPMFLCDVMVEGLAKHLRCVGIDAAIPYTKKPDPRDLINQAQRENRILLTRDAKLLRYQYAIKNQIYRVKRLLKNEQLLEVIETFQLKISEDQLMSRCTKCNGRFVQKPLTTEEALEAAKGFQRIPSCLFNQNLEFWQCMDCNQLYWEGTQYKNAVQKFIDVCKLND